MPNQRVSTKLSKSGNKSLSRWNEAIAEAKQKIKEFRSSIRTFESLRDQGMVFPEPKATPKRARRSQPSA
jgi:hypothetical protein